MNTIFSHTQKPPLRLRKLLQASDRRTSLLVQASGADVPLRH